MWMGIQKIRSAFEDSAAIEKAPAVTLKSLWLKGFVTSVANPKAVVFFAALFTQFISQEIALMPQILILGVTYILVDGLFLTAYGKSASWLAQH
ncbi:MAG: threonine/homoserine/homoserine lactone efflux protein [Alphaproteobacteria bacterium]|jgi:threonine/homoserine/homoserine lactone efflux protein